MNKIETNYTKQIIKLHEQVQANLKRTLEDAIRIGELLNLKKQELGHGNFGDWIKSSLPFTDRTARNYIKVYSKQNELKMESVSDLQGAYKLLKAPQKHSDDDHFQLPDFENMMKEIIRFLENDCKSREHAENYFKILERNLKRLQDEYGIYRIDMEKLKEDINVGLMEHLMESCKQAHSP